MKCEITVPRGCGQGLALRRDLAARARVARLACKRGRRALDVGTGPCACMARILARCHLRVTAIDNDSSAVRFAQEVAALRALRRWLDVQDVDAARMPFADASYRVVLAFDSLGHSSAPHLILAEMFRVCTADGVVLITESNRRGRKATRHKNFDFETRLAKNAAAALFAVPTYRATLPPDVCMSKECREKRMSDNNVVTVRVFGVPTANSCGSQGGWREATEWVTRSFKTRFGDQVRVEYFDLFSDAVDAFPNKQRNEYALRGHFDSAVRPLVYRRDAGTGRGVHRDTRARAVWL